MSTDTGRVITFYSFKGGTGRTMALANVATSIAQRNSNRVLMVDWDLEAPGLHRYFRPYLRLTGDSDRDEEIERSSGLIELLENLRARVSSVESKLSRTELLTSVFQEVELERFLLDTDLPTLTLLKAGRFDSTYGSRINAFAWTRLFNRQPEFFGAFADFLASRFTHVLVDSRTGYTDISGICTSLLPDSLVVVFTPNLQSLCGAIEMAERAVTYRVGSDDLRPLRTFPIVSRVELSELKLNDSWRFGDPAEDVQGYQPQFERLFEKLYGIESCNLTDYFDRAQIAYVPYYAFGEKIASRSEESGTIRLARNFSEMTDLLLADPSPWEVQRTVGDSDVKPEVPWDAQWFEGQTKPQLTPAYVELRASLSRVKPSTSRGQVLNAIRAAVPSDAPAPLQVPQVAPVAPADAVGVFMPSKLGAYCYWSVRLNGDCLLIQPVPYRLNPLEFSVEELIGAIAESLLGCRRLYANLGVTPRAELRVEVRIQAAASVSLLVPATQYGGLHTKSRTSWVPHGHSEEIVLGRIDHDIPALTKRFAEPMIGAFENWTLSAEDYERILGGFSGSVT